MIIGLGREMYKKITVITLLTGVCENKTVYQRQLFILLKKYPQASLCALFSIQMTSTLNKGFLVCCHFVIIL